MTRITGVLAGHRRHSEHVVEGHRDIRDENLDHCLPHRLFRRLRAHALGGLPARHRCLLTKLLCQLPRNPEQEDAADEQQPGDLGEAVR